MSTSIPFLPPDNQPAVPGGIISTIIRNAQIVGRFDSINRGRHKYPRWDREIRYSSLMDGEVITQLKMVIYEFVPRFPLQQFQCPWNFDQEYPKFWEHHLNCQIKNLGWILFHWDHQTMCMVPSQIIKHFYP